MRQVERVQRLRLETRQSALRAPWPGVRIGILFECSQTIFDGKTLNGWEGDPKYWRVENGALVGEVTPETLLKTNSFVIWRGGVTKDFELKVDYRITDRGNSGITNENPSRSTSTISTTTPSRFMGSFQ